MADARDELKAFLEAQRADYARQLPAKVAALEAHWEGARAGDAQQLRALERAAHSIYGAAGTYGLRDVGERAGRIEALASQALEAGGALAADQAAALAAAVSALRLSLPAPP